MEILKVGNMTTERKEGIPKMICPKCGKEWYGRYLKSYPSWCTCGTLLRSGEEIKRKEDQV